jgi:hypothetical protein
MKLQDAKVAASQTERVKRAGRFYRGECLWVAALAATKNPGAAHTSLPQAFAEAPGEATMSYFRR